MITKSDFLEYLNAPLHLWATQHGIIEVALSLHDRHLMEQGKEVEKLAKVFLDGYLGDEKHDFTLTYERTFIDGHFQARVDAIVLDTEEEVFDIYEIKSATSTTKEHKYDLAFQRLVCEANIPIRNVFIVLLNKEFVRNGDIDISNLFIVEDLTEETDELKEEIAFTREEAWLVSTSKTKEGILGCIKPNDCPCISLCHPGLSKYPIFDLSRLHKNKARQLIGAGVLAIRDIPAGFPLTNRQLDQFQAVKLGEPVINHEAIKGELAKLEYPLHFLDYETYNPAVPFFDGYKPYQHMVFQYSLHVVEALGIPEVHFYHLVTDVGNPGIQLVQELSQHIGLSGSVIVWNKGFEAGRNIEMAAMYPEYEAFLLGINTRIYDLMECFRKGFYVHPDFHGSASIKKVLPVLVKDDELDYGNLVISEGTEAMLTWAELMFDSDTRKDLDCTREALIQYCRLDTLAMVRIWEVLERISKK
jgi:hypothetical protein